MENAAQALLIAGGILLAILTLSLLVYMFNNVNTIGTAQAQEKEAKRLAAWNAEWEAYNKRRLYGAEVLTVINKKNQNNADYDNNSQYKVNVDIVGMDETEIINNKTSVFECIEMETNTETGRIQNIKFKFVE